MRTILHMDMDCFFAQIEERESPHFKGKPIVVGADPREGRGRGVVSTCNYEARKYGVRSGMPISKSYQLIPGGVFLPVNMELYKKVSHSIFKIAEKYSKKIEKVSLDEAYIDLTGKVDSFKEAEKKGGIIREEVFEKENLTCTVGIGENKMMAKIACELAKPNGLMSISLFDSSVVLSEMDVEVIPGIGPKTKKKISAYLDKKEVRVRDAKKITKREFLKLLGKRGGEFYYKLRGKDDSPVESKKKTRSIGKEHTFKRDTKELKKIIEVFKRMVFSVAKRSNERNIAIKGVVVTCRYEDFKTHSRQTSFPADFYKGEFLYKKSLPSLFGFLTGNSKRIRLVGFRAKIKE